MDRNSAVRQAAEILGLENHEIRIRRDAEYAYQATRNRTIIRELHAILSVARRLELLVRDVTPPVMFDLLDIADATLRPPCPMLIAEEIALTKYMRKLLANSPMAKLEVTPEREIVLWAFLYDHDLKRSILHPVSGSVDDLQEVM